jgi:hypothetical protein
MYRLTLGDLKLALADLLAVRLEDLKQSAFGGLYLPLLTAKKEAIDALPEAMTSGLPLAAQLAETDDEHDGLGGSVWFITEAVLRHPTLTPALRTAAMAIRTAFVPELGVLRKPHADEAAAAYNHRADLTRLEVELTSITVPGGQTLYTWVSDFLDKGDHLGSLLAMRGQAQAGAESAKQAGALRAGAIGLLGRLRSSIQDEVAGSANLPAGYEAKLFATFDELSKRREEAAHRKAAAEKAAGVAAAAEKVVGEKAVGEKAVAEKAVAEKAKAETPTIPDLISETPAEGTPAK